ncbi:MAG: aspartyl/asparaginyl beta-hydroxylase domain-containing protein [Ginsengibacter sp.]
MIKDIKAKVQQFVTFRISNRILAFMGKLMSPFSKVSTGPVMKNSEFEWSTLLEENWKDIQSEVNSLLKTDQNLPNIQEIQPQEALLSSDNKWKTFFLYGFGIKAEKNCKKCPATTRVLEQIPNLLTGFFSILYPGKHIPAHRGIFKGIVRTHLGLVVPGHLGDCRMKVGNEMIKWRNGKAVFFDDTYTHEVWNDSNGIRVVLLIDTVRPYAKIASKVNRSIINGITNSVYVKQAFRKNEDWEKTYYNLLP